jgi:transposase-like protein
MADSTLSEARFHDEKAARAHLEAIRWPNGPVCPHCGGTERNSALKGKAHRPGLWTCGDCRTQFSVTVGTLFERSKVPLHKWLLATHLLCSSKKGISSHQIHRTLGVTYKTAWFMTHRIRESMKEQHTDQLGGPGTSGIVEADETLWGNKGRKRRSPARTRTYKQKDKIVSLVERDGRVRSFHVESVNQSTLRSVLKAQIVAVHPDLTHFEG